jgi:RNA polymerase sigma-70 factor (ECF subfamily)
LRLSSCLAEAWQNAADAAARVGGTSSAPPLAAPRDEAALEASLEGALRAGRARWPDLTLAPERFVAHLAAIVPATEPAPAAAIAALHAADLYLTCACANGAPGAVERFEETHLRALGPVLGAALQSSAVDVDEVRQRLRVRLFVGDAGRGPLVGSYSGRGALSAWVRVAAVRLALTLARDVAIGARAGRRASDEGALAGRDVDPELAFIKERYRREFEEAFGAALSAASTRERALLRLNVVGGLSLEQIGKMYGVDRSTISRWLADARRALLDNTEMALKQRLGTAPADFASMARLFTSQLEIDLPELLRTHGDTPRE